MSAKKLTALVRTLPQRSDGGARISGKLTSTFLVRRAAHLPQPAPKRASGYQPATAVGGYVPKLTKKAFEKYGFSTASLIMDWAAIVGRDIASATLPEKLKWPRSTSDEANVGNEGAVLVLRVDPARALDISYRERQIADRINAHFGYRAIAALRLVQAPLDHPQTAKPEASANKPVEAKPSGRDPLSEALSRLESGLKSARRNLSAN